VSAPSSASVPICRDCSKLLQADLTPAPFVGRTSFGCCDRPGGFSQLERRETAGSPNFPQTLSSLATLLDPGRPSGSSPEAVPSVLGAVFPTSSPPALKRLEAESLHRGANPSSGSRSPLCTLLRSRPSPGDRPACPPAEQHSVTAGWLSLCISVLSFQNSTSRLRPEADDEGLSSPEFASFSWRTGNCFLRGPLYRALRR
jgi:hypothetical protein